MNFLKNKTYQVFGVLIAIVLLCRKPKDETNPKDISESYEPTLGTRKPKLEKDLTTKISKDEINSTYLEPKKVKPFIVNEIKNVPLRGNPIHASNDHIKSTITKGSKIRKDIVKGSPITKDRVTIIRPRKEPRLPNKPL